MDRWSLLVWLDLLKGLNPSAQHVGLIALTKEEYHVEVCSCQVTGFRSQVTGFQET